MGSCFWIPQVENKDTKELVNSKLYIDLMAYTGNNRDKTLSTYVSIKNSIANNTAIQDKLSFDENDEPTIRSLFRETNLKKFLDDQDIINTLNKRLGHYKERSKDELNLVREDSKESSELIDRAIDFNENSEFKDEYVANIFTIKDSDSGVLVGIKVERRTNDNTRQAQQMAYNRALNLRLIEILKSKGVSIGALTELERRMGIGGVADFSKAKQSAKGLVELIRLCEGIKGEKSLPEEFAHFIIEAMDGHPIIDRLINLIANKDLTREILGEDYEHYSEIYNDDVVKLAKEAAGKLLAKHLLQSESVPVKPYRNILTRAIEAIKSFFRKLKATDIQKAMIKADKEFGIIASQILEGSIDSEVNVANIKTSDFYYNTTERIERDKKIVKKIIDTELKRLKVYSNTAREEITEAQQQLILELEKSLNENKEIEAIYSFLETATKKLSSVNRRFSELNNLQGSNLKEKAKLLRNIRNYIYSYKRISSFIREALIEEESFSDNRYGERVKVSLDQVDALIRDAEVRFNKYAMPLFVEFLKPFVGENITFPFGKWKGKTVTIEELLEGVKRDKDGKVEWYQEEISIFDRWLDSAADSADYALKMIDQAVKQSRETARLDTIEVAKKIQALAIELEKKGVKDYNWMYERDDEGNLTGNYISKYNVGLFRKRKREFYKHLREKYGKNPKGKDYKNYREEERAWYRENQKEVDGYTMPSDKYLNKFYQELMDEDSSKYAAHRKFFKAIMNIKKELDSYLPDNATTLNNAIKIRKDLLERVKASDGVKSGAKALWESVKDDFLRRGDDIEFGSKAIVKDFEGNIVQTLPLFYLKFRDREAINDMSTDIVSTMIAYANMAHNYREMDKVIDVLEVGRSILVDRELIQESANKPMVEKFKVMERKVEDFLTKGQGKTRNAQRLEDYFSMQVYQRYMEDEGTFGSTGIDKGKTANFINKMTALNTYALNLLAGISNVTTGTIMMKIESYSEEFFSRSNVRHADTLYMKNMPSVLGEVGSRVKISKLNLWNELFNTLQDFDTDVRDIRFDRKNRIARMMSEDSLYFLNNIGEHWMQTRTSLALADTYKMKDRQGNIVSLWDAMEVVYIDPNDKSKGATLKVKEGYTKEDGTKFTRKDIIEFGKKVKAINQRMHGIYNEADKNAIQKLGIGRMAIMYRKWIKPALNRRWKSAQMNYDLDTFTEGYYRTTGRFIKTLYKDFKKGEFNYRARLNELHPIERANLRRAMTEVGYFIAIIISLGILNKFWFDDKKKRPWYKALIEYQLRRLYTEIGSQAPTPLALEEIGRIIKSPAAGVDTTENTFALFGLLNPWNYETIGGEDAIIQSGRYKGHTRAAKLIYESPFAPIHSMVYKAFHPEEGINYYK